MTERKKPTQSISFPYFLHTEEDRYEWARSLISRQAAYDEFHRQVMAFLLPQQVELKRDWVKWWDTFCGTHNVPPGTPLRVNGRMVELIDDERKDKDHD